MSFDFDMNYIYVNKKGGELLGRKPEDLIGKNYWKEYPEAEGSVFADSYVKALENKISVSFESYYETWGRWFENRIYPMPEGIAVYFTETTDRKLAEEKINHLNVIIKSVRDVNQLINMEGNREALITKTCRILTKDKAFEKVLIVLFISSGGFLVLLSGLFESYRVWPIQSFYPSLDAKFPLFFLQQTDRLMRLTVILASPVIIAVFVSELGLGLINRFAPQRNVFFLSMPIKSAIASFLLVLYLSFLLLFFKDHLVGFKMLIKFLRGIIGG